MLYTVWIIMLVTGTLLLFLSIILMFTFRVPDLLDELSGRKAKRQIKRLKELNGGTGALENISSGFNTDDIYSAISSGSLISKEISEIQEVGSIPEPLEDVKKSVVCQEVKNITSEESTGIMGITPSSSNVNSASSVEEKTGYMSEIATSYIEDSDVTNILSDVECHKANKRVVEILEEQTSI